VPARQARALGVSTIPTAAVSQLVREREGFDLLPEMGCKPVNKYCRRGARRTKAAQTAPRAVEQPADNSGFPRRSVLRLGRQDPAR